MRIKVTWDQIKFDIHRMLLKLQAVNGKPRNFRMLFVVAIIIRDLE